MIIRCPFCTRSHSIAEITKEQIQSEADNPTGVLVSDLPNPSSDEEVERIIERFGVGCPLSNSAFKGILHAALLEQRKQHNAEREKLEAKFKAAQTRFELSSTLAAERGCETSELKDQIDQLRAYLAEKEKELSLGLFWCDGKHYDGPAILEALNDQKQHTSAVQSELATAHSKLNELVMAVGTKFPGESRFETALRYINEREAAVEPDQPKIDKH